MQSTFGSQRVAWLKLEVNFRDKIWNLDGADLDLSRPGGAFCYCSASMRAFLAT